MRAADAGNFEAAADARSEREREQRAPGQAAAHRVAEDRAEAEETSVLHQGQFGIARARHGVENRRQAGRTEGPRDGAQDPERGAGAADGGNDERKPVTAAAGQNDGDDGVERDLDAERPIGVVNPGSSREEDEGAQIGARQLARLRVGERQRDASGDRGADPRRRREPQEAAPREGKRGLALRGPSDDEAGNGEENFDADPARRRERRQPGKAGVNADKAVGARMRRRASPEPEVKRHDHESRREAKQVDARDLAAAGRVLDEGAFVFSHVVTLLLRWFAVRA